MSIAGVMKQTPATSSPAQRRRAHPIWIASSVEVGPGIRLAAPRRSRNCWSSSQPRRRTTSSRITAICAAGPPKAVAPSLRKSAARSSKEVGAVSMTAIICPKRPGVYATSRLDVGSVIHSSLSPTPVQKYGRRLIRRRKFLALLTTLGPAWACRRAAVAPAAPPPQPATPTEGPPLHPDALARFVDPLPVPRTLAPNGTRPDPRDPTEQVPFYKVAMTEVVGKIHRDVPPTRFWGYGGSFPGPTIEARGGQGIVVEWVNQLPTQHFLPIDHTLCGAGEDRPDVRAVTHVHGAKAPPESDGYPEDWTTAGHSSLFHYPNQQEAATLWYHDHAMGIERLNQYAGLLGVYLLRDAAEEVLDLPRGPYELPLVLCDRLFGQDGQLRYSTSGAPDAPWISEIYCDA